jgi:hypothetical protein
MAASLNFCYEIYHFSATATYFPLVFSGKISLIVDKTRRQIENETTLSRRDASDWMGIRCNKRYRIPYRVIDWSVLPEPRQRKSSCHHDPKSCPSPFGNHCSVERSNLGERSLRRVFNRCMGIQDSFSYTDCSCGFGILKCCSPDLLLVHLFSGFSQL